LITSETYRRLKDEIRGRIEADNGVLDQLRTEIRPLCGATRRIHPRAATAVSLVATDGGNNQLRFDPFLVQIVRVVDSNDNEYCIDVVSPSTPIAEIDARQFDSAGQPITPLGRLMNELRVISLAKLSHMITPSADGVPQSATWIQVYRELVEWAVLLDLLKRDYGSDTLIVFDGDLRSKAFAGSLFTEGLGRAIEREIKRHAAQRRKVFVVGIMKSSQALSRYRLAMALEHVLRGAYPAYVQVPEAVEKSAIRWDEYARRTGTGEGNKVVLGTLFFVKFGARPRDPIWPIDVLTTQASEADRIFGHLLADAIEGFPVPLYPRCLQKAHERAALVDFDMDILQDAIFSGLRSVLGSDAQALDAFRLQDSDPAQGRYR